MPKLYSMLKTNVRYIGWDFALTNDGCVVVEGNQVGDFKFLQIANSRGLKEDLIKLI